MSTTQTLQFTMDKKAFPNPIKATRYLDRVIQKIGTCSSLKYYYPTEFKLFRRILKFHPEALERGIINEEGEYVLRDLCIKYESPEDFQLIAIGHNKCISRINYFKAVLAKYCIYEAKRKQLQAETQGNNDEDEATTKATETPLVSVVAAEPVYVHPMLFEAQREQTNQQTLRRSSRLRKAPSRYLS